MSDWVDIAGKTALVTGAGKRLGCAVALALGRAGANVAIHYNTSRDEATVTASVLDALGVRCWTFQCDLSVPDQVAQLLPQVIETAGPIDFLVNNASIFPAQPLLGFSHEELVRCLDVNTWAPFVLAKGIAAQCREGAIINFLDTMIADYDRAHVPYHLSKQMLFSLTRMMAMDFSPRVRVSAVAPGLVLPPEGEDAGYLKRLSHTNPLQRHGAEEGVCEAVLFLLRSGFVTGQVIFVDGGRHLRGKMYG